MTRPAILTELVADAPVGAVALVGGWLYARADSGWELVQAGELAQVAKDRAYAEAVARWAANESR